MQVKLMVGIIFCKRSSVLSFLKSSVRRFSCNVLFAVLHIRLPDFPVLTDGFLLKEMDNKTAGVSLNHGGMLSYIRQFKSEVRINQVV